ncbi:MAG: LD-carboxypeptidase [Bdellovibrionaceae bacterium]|nr:LD-carboxypeptidase [Pseudobdellovibrionaceae bacterium]
MMSIRTDDRLKIAVVAPGFPSRVDVQKKFKEFAHAHSNEFEFDIPKKIIQKNPMFSNGESQRAEFIVNAMSDDRVDVVWCLRGGYGSLPLLKYLKAMPKPKKKKLLVGLSDITSLHLFVNEFWGWTSVHGSNLDRWIAREIPGSVLKALVAIVKNESERSHYKNIKPLNDLAKKQVKSIRAPLTGGNLVTLCSHLGTPFQTSFKNRFLFLEEIGERAYRIDRLLTQLQLSGVLKGCSGILLGQFTSCLEPDGKKLWPWVVKEWAKNVGVPVFGGVPSGHEKAQWPLSFGTPAEVKIINDHGHLIIENKR